jgi:hypothetical protein
MKKLLIIIVLLAFAGLNETMCQWTTNGNHIYNSNTGNVGIGTSTPGTLLFVAKEMTEPAITVRNLGGLGGATYSMMDNASGANWKFKATNSGGFKIRDQGNSLDVFVIEPNSAANVLYINAAGSLGVGTATPAASAAVDISSNNKGLLIPRMTLSQIQSISTPENGLQVFCSTDSKLYIYIAPSNQWKEMAFGSGTINPPWSCGASFVINHVAGNVAPVTRTITYGTVTNIPGEATKCWITRNLGAEYQAFYVNWDAEASAGWYWQFNRKQGYKHDSIIATPSWTISSINENSNWIAGNDPCTIELGAGWRLPTSTEWSNIDAAGSWTNWSGPWDSPLKMHAAGFVYAVGGGLQERGYSGHYWSSTQGNNTAGMQFTFWEWDCSVSTFNKANGASCRCIRE